MLINQQAQFICLTGKANQATKIPDWDFKDSGSSI